VVCEVTVSAWKQLPPGKLRGWILEFCRASKKVRGRVDVVSRDKQLNPNLMPAFPVTPVIGYMWGVYTFPSFSRPADEGPVAAPPVPEGLPGPAKRAKRTGANFRTQADQDRLDTQLEYMRDTYGLKKSPPKPQLAEDTSAREPSSDKTHQEGLEMLRRKQKEGEKKR
jgi:hypothetical protein